MAYTLGDTYAKNLCKQTYLFRLIIENVVTCFLEHSVDVHCPRPAQQLTEPRLPQDAHSLIL